MKLMISSILIFGVLCGFVFCYNDCLFPPTTFCLGQKYGAPFSPNNMGVVCKKLDEFITCLERSLSQCKHETAVDFNDLQSRFKEICINGSEMNKKMLDTGKCVSKNPIRLNRCFEPILLRLSDHLSSENPDNMTILNLTCNALNPAVKCFYDELEEICGKEIRDFSETISEPLDQLNREYCTRTFGTYKEDEGGVLSADGKNETLLNVNGGGSSTKSPFSWTVLLIFFAYYMRNKFA